MTFKTNLHFHCAEDSRHSLPYTLRDGIDYACLKGFEVLALTCHRAFLSIPEHVTYAKTKGVLLISGIEAEIFDEHGRGSHVLILNGDKESELLSTFNELRRYKEKKPNIFVIAPHPYFYGNFSLHSNLEKHIDVFDAIEHSWFYTCRFNRNLQAENIAKRHNKPFIATSDTHFLEILDTDYTLVDAMEKTPQAIFNAIRVGKYHNMTSPHSFLATFVRFGWFTLIDEIILLIRRVKGSG